MEPSYFSCIPIAIALYLFTIHIWRKLQKSPPGPFLCFPVIGHLYLFMFPTPETYTKLANKFGSVVLLYVGSRQLLIVSSPSATEECLAQNDIIFCNRPQGSMMGEYMGNGYTSLNFAPYGAHWKNLRKVSAVEILSSTRLQRLSSIRAEEVRSLVKQLLLTVSCQDEPAVIDTRSLFIDTTLSIMTRMIFGKRYYRERGMDKKGLRLQEMLSDTVRLLNTDTVSNVVPWLKWLDWKAEREFKDFSQRRDLLMGELIEEHKLNWELEQNRSTDSDSMPKPLIQVLLELQESDPDYYNDKVIQSIAVDLMVGGSDTSAGTMEWAFSLLLNHPDVLKKAQVEIDNHVGYKRILDESDLSQLPYLRCIINETLRMYPPIPHLLPHEASTDCVVGGYRIPRGTMLQVNAYSIQNDPKIWGDPQNFRPERFEGVESHRVGYKMFPFGVGRRSCPGEGLAIRVIGLTIGCLIQCFEWERIDRVKLEDMTAMDRFNLQKAKPLEAKIKSRQVTMNLLKVL